MEFVVLGPVQLLGPGGNRIDLASDAQRRLVSHLALRAGTIVRAAELEDHLGLSSGALRTSVCRLRRVVGYDILVTAPPGYELRTDAIDAVRFEHLLAVGRACTLQTDVDGATVALRAALALWRGEPYAEFSHEDWARAEAARLLELRAGAIEDLAALHCDAGEWSLAIALLDQLTAEQPLRERPHLISMRALACSGRRAEALREYQAFHRMLAAETGTRPSAALVALDRQIATGEADEAALVARWAREHGFALVPVRAS